MGTHPVSTNGSHLVLSCAKKKRIDVVPSFNDEARGAAGLQSVAVA